MDDSLQMVQTRGSQLTKKAVDFQAVVFNSRKRIESAPSEVTKVPQRTGPEFDIKTATKEIIKLGATGFYQRRRERTLKSLAVELGAKPEKNRHKNYQELKDVRKKNRERKEERLKMMAESRKITTKKHRRSRLDVNILTKYGKRR